MREGKIKVSVIVPCYNEQATIKNLLMNLYQQDFPLHEMEVIISDGMSTDDTRNIIQGFQKDHADLWIGVVDNEKRTIPSGLNRALEAARGQYIVRLDAHSSPAPDYITRSVRALKAGKGDNIGGVLNIEPGSESWIAGAIAAAAGHPLGVGDARYRTGSDAREVDTVAYGTYRASLVDDIGPYDESLLANEDYEFNVRLRQAGGTIWLDPEIQATYVARPTLNSLARQYWRYGYWKLRMLLRYPGTFRWRQLSGAFVLTWIVLGLLSVWFRLARWLIFLEALIYLLALLGAGLGASIKERKGSYFIGVPLAIATMHFAWGSGFLWSLVEYAGQALFRAD